MAPVLIIVGIFVVLYLVRVGNNWLFGKAEDAFQQRALRRERQRRGLD
jgi:hypothetical protein